MSSKKKPTPLEELHQAPVAGIRLIPSTASYESCMKQTAKALGYPGDKPLRTSPNLFVLSLTGLGCSSAPTKAGNK
jgi:hypothetical protein